jgi:hypothetical protein
MRPLVLVGAVLACSGCAAILGTSQKNFDLQSAPSGADVYLDGNRIGTTPARVKLDNHKTHTFVYKRNGFKDGSCTLAKGTGAGWVIFDVISGLVPIIIDAATNSWTQTQGSSCTGSLEPLTGDAQVATGQDQRRTAPPVAPALQPRSAPTPLAVDPTTAPIYAAPIATMGAANVGEAVDDDTRNRRQAVVEDMTRLGVVSLVEQGPPGVVRVAIGENFYSEGAKAYYFRQLSGEYYAWSTPTEPLVIELWDQGQKFGEYADHTFLLGPRYSKARGCDEQSVGLCTALAAPIAPASPTSPIPPSKPVQSSGGSPSPAAEPHVVPAATTGHSGFHLGLGLGGGYGALSCNGCGLSRESAVSGYLSLSGAVGKSTLLGLETTGWTKNGGDGTAQIYSIMAQLTGYLNESSGLFLTSGLGLVGYHQATAFGPITGNSFGFSGRLGIEIPVGSSAAIIPYAAYISTIGGADFKLDGSSVGQKLDISNIQFGLAFGLR